MELFLAKLLPFINAFASSSGGGGSTITKVVQWVGGIGGGIVAIFLIVGLVKDGIALGKGSGDASIFKILTKVLFLIIILGLIALAINYGKLQGVGNTIGDKMLNTVNDELPHL